MKNSIKYIVNIAVSLLIALSVSGQTDSHIQSDSLNTSLLKEYDNKLKLFEQQRLEDSLKKSELDLQLSQLKTTDNLKKEELQKQLQELSSKNAKRIAEKILRIDSLRLTAKSFPVNGLFNDTLFLIYSKLGSFSAKDRAEAIEARVKKLVDNFEFKTNARFTS